MEVCIIAATSWNLAASRRVSAATADVRTEPGATVIHRPIGQTLDYGGGQPLRRTN